MDNNNGRSDKSQDEQIDNDAAFSAIAGAMTSGNYAELDRLMAAKNGVDTEEDKDKDGQSDDKTPVEGEEDQTQTSVDDDKSDKTGAADEAAPTESKAEQELNALKAELHRLRSEVGRVGHLQRTVQELQRQQSRAPDARQTQQTQTQTTKPKELPEDLQKRITALKEVDPEMAETFEVFAKTLAQQTSEEANSVRQTFEEKQREAEELQFYSQQKAELVKIVPRCDEIFGMSEWQEWKDLLTPGQRAMAESAYAQDVAYAIQAFASYMQQRQGTTQTVNRQASAGGGDPANSTQVDTAQQSDSTNAVNDARTRKVAAAADVKSSAAKTDSTLDEKAYFEEMYNKIGKANHILPK